ncbi:WS/DGAT/MGAT family O-acyltransferase [Pseudomarimonas salicorniae]|uniref:diacylglycerol O-acyltransferase n=1 Tax=Pseudomarimonas salicorniae TaxID=2933270 RepID=A0ABT0GIF7_9GAMM|nr:wax ester/triacylglycerol synthase family O-acyltransferase [Lysobacter sp. CAU 1642]MCK7594137.1 wax ester/triacylglycerol synthase family O-acyltransferase [Lysobacter sp. CAU 1642]
MGNRALNLLDASWLLVESRETPMHVGALMPFSLPADAGPDFVRRIMAVFRSSDHVQPPWNRRLKSPKLKGLVPVWEEVEEIDLEHHVHHSALPHPGGERELGQHIARLHSQPLDLSRPPWEVELIEGLEGGRFALYTKVHHALMDGIGGVKLLVRAMSTDSKQSQKIQPFWTIKPEKKPERRKRSRAEAPAATAAQIAADLMDKARFQAGTVPDVARAFGAMIGAVRNKEDVLKIPFDTPTSVLNGRIHGPRRFATQRFRLDRLKALAKATDATLNDIVLALCGGALRRFLDELGELPEKSLTAGIPVSVRPRDDAESGNAITFIISTLGTDIADPLERLETIRASTRRAKEHVQSMPREAMLQYTLLLMAPYMGTLLTGIGGRTRPMFNITISNVPGPEKPLYFRGARLEASYPVSLVTHGQALNITCQSYDGHLNFGFTGCRDSLPHMQRVATYTGEALAELEALLLAPGARARPAGRSADKPAKQAAKPAAAKGKSKAKAKPKPKPKPKPKSEAKANSKTKPAARKTARRPKPKARIQDATEVNAPARRRRARSG